jgi:thioredoxin reductase (NADPH)
MATSEQPDRAADRPKQVDASPVLSGRRFEALRRYGRVRAVHEEEILFEAGDADYDFYVVVDGAVAVIGEREGEQRTLAIHGRGEFVGDLSLLSGGIAFATAVVRQDGQLLQVPAARLREVVEDEPELSELILQALLMRRSRLIRDGGGVEIIGRHESQETQALRRFLRRNGVPRPRARPPGTRPAPARERDARADPRGPTATCSAADTADRR